MENKLQIFCPYCGSRLIDGTEATKINLICRRCKTKLTATFDNKKIQLEICRNPKLSICSNNLI